MTKRKRCQEVPAACAQGHRGGGAAGVGGQESSQREVGLAQDLGTRAHLWGRGAQWKVPSRGRRSWGCSSVLGRGIPDFGRSRTAHEEEMRMLGRGPVGHGGLGSRERADT